MSICAVVVSKRVRGLVWTGVLSSRRLTITYETRKMVCPLCQHELVPARYFGNRVFQHDVMKLDYVNNFWVPLYENGERVWCEAPDLKGAW